MVTKKLPDDLLYNDYATAASKLKDFIHAGPGQLQLVLDFDRTLTVGRAGTDAGATTWHILGAHLPQEGQDRHSAIFRDYHPKELAGTLRPEESAKAWAAVLDLFAEYRIDLNEVEQDFLSKATIRPGTKELFELCARHNIPTVIMSAGVKDIIDIWTRTYGIRPTVTLSTSLQTDSRNRICGWDRGSLVHILNKKEVGHPELTNIRKTRSKTILVGDSLNDIDMAEGVENVFRVRLYDSRPDEGAGIHIVRQQTFRHFDAIVESGSLEPVRQIVDLIAAKK